jgi:hypothetical protein
MIAGAKTGTATTPGVVRATSVTNAVRKCRSSAIRPRSSTKKTFSPPASMVTPKLAPSVDVIAASSRISCWNSSKVRDPTFSETTALMAMTSTPSSARSCGRNCAPVPCE